MISGVMDDDVGCPCGVDVVDAGGVAPWSAPVGCEVVPDLVSSSVVAGV